MPHIAVVSQLLRRATANDDPTFPRATDVSLRIKHEIKLVDNGLAGCYPITVFELMPAVVRSAFFNIL